MPDRSTGGTPIDSRSHQIKILRLQHDISGLDRNVEEQKIRILEAELNIERLHENIAAIKAGKAKKQEELEVLMGG